MALNLSDLTRIQGIGTVSATLWQRQMSDHLTKTEPFPAPAGLAGCLGFPVATLPVMKSLNFEFLRATHRELADLGGFAEGYVHSDPTACLVKLRTFAEFLVKALFSHHQLELTYQSNLNDLLADHSFKSITPAVVQDKLHLLRVKGNHAAHGTLHATTPGQMTGILREAHDLAKWFALSCGLKRRDELPAWQEPIALAGDTKSALQREKKAALQKLAEQEALMAKLLADLETARSQAEAAHASAAEKSALLNRAQQAASALDFSEEETRFKLIDELLAAAGWKVGPRGQNTEEIGQEVEVLHQPVPSGKGRADYVQWDPDNGMPLGVIEGKRTAEDAAKGKMQAKYYADGLEKEYGQRPVIFFTNGYEVFIWDDTKGEPPRAVFGFYSLDSLRYCIFQRNQRDAVLADLFPKESIIDRLYQIEGVKRTCENFDKRRRQALLIQATGTGKTRVAIAISEVMIRAKWAKRILFLCDRRELRKQAGDAFDEFLPSEPRVIVTRATANDREKRIYLATYPAMMKCFQNFDVGFFDLIIADESHRSIYNRFRDLFRYFDCFQVGLTATPLKFVFRNTYQLFGCENEDPTANFTYDEAVDHKPPYLCPFTVVKHTTKFLRQGIKYKDLSPEQREQLDEQTADSESIDYDKEQVSRQVFNKDTDRAILRNLMENGIRNADGTRLGKSIVFARNHRHAKQLVETFDEIYPQYGGDFCSRIDNYEPRADQLICDFKAADGSKNLTIAVSVDMLDTGIDIPEIVNLVFAKPVKSYSKFWQMIGRGTRLCENLFGPGRHKTTFRIFDHWGNFEYFDELKKEVPPTRSQSLPEQLFEARIALADAALAAQDLDAFKLAIRLIAADIAALPAGCLSIREKWKDIQSMKKDGVLEAFSAATRATLKNVITPLMVWRDVRSKEPALKFDLLTARLSIATLAKSSDAADLRDELIDRVSRLPINLQPVQEKLPAIQQAKRKATYETATPVDIDTLRTELRGIMRYQVDDTGHASEPRYLDVAEDPAEIKTSGHHVKLAGLDLAAYRIRVESVLRELFGQSAALRNIRAGLPVAEADLDQLVEDVLLHDPDLHLDELLNHYPNKSQSLALAIRRVIGMDAEKVNEHFKAFVQQFPALNANQIRFLELLKSHIATYGAIEIERLWESPFTTLHAEGIDGIFPDTAQIDSLLDLLQNLNLTAA